MNINQVFPSKWLSAPDFQGREPTVTIAKITMEEVEPGKIKPCLWFHGKEKGLILNKTNASNIAFLYGEETDAWIGQQITMFATWVDFQGRSVEAIRVKPQANPQGAVQAQAAQTPQQQGNAAQAPQGNAGQTPEGIPGRYPDDIDDEIPF